MAITKKNLKLLTDPNTPTEVIEELAMSTDLATSRMALRHPNLSMETWRDRFTQGEPEAWDSPLVLLQLMEPDTIQEKPFEYALKAYLHILKDRKRFLPDGMALITSQIEEFWRESKDAIKMAMTPSRWSEKGNRLASGDLYQALISLIERSIGDPFSKEFGVVLDKSIRLMRNSFDPHGSHAKEIYKEINLYRKVFEKAQEQREVILVSSLRSLFLAMSSEDSDPRSYVLNSISFLCQLEVYDGRAETLEDAQAQLADEFRKYVSSAAKFL